MASKDSYPKGSAMNMIIPVAFIELDVREVLNGDQTLKKLSDLTHFQSKQFLKAAFINPQNATTVFYYVIFLSVLFFTPTVAMSCFFFFCCFLSWSIR